MKKAIVFAGFVLFSLMNLGTLSAAEWLDGTEGAIYYNGGNVGVGISEPEYNLSVSDKIYIYSNNPALIIADFLY